jgi:hypothetical protein
VKQCVHCGRALYGDAPAAFPTPQNYPQAPAGYPPGYGPPPGYPQGYAAPGYGAPPYPQRDAADAALGMVVPVNQSGWAIASGYLGLFSLLCGVLGPFAILTGVLALAETKRKPGLGGSVRATIGIVLGTLGTLFFAVGLVFVLLDAM